jgi:hypothetical protein
LRLARLPSKASVAYLLCSRFENPQPHIEILARILLIINAYAADKKAPHGGRSLSGKPDLALEGLSPKKKIEKKIIL